MCVVSRNDGNKNEPKVPSSKKVGQNRMEDREKTSQEWILL